MPALTPHNSFLLVTIMRSVLNAAPYAITLLVLGTPGAVVAQRDSVAGPRFREAFASLPEGRTIKVLRASGTTVGQIVGVTGDSLSLSVKDAEPTTLAIAEVTEAWTRKHNTGKGALIGGIAGVVIGAVLGGVASGFCETDPCDSAGSTAVAGGLVVGIGGAAIGALIGAAIPGWKRVST